MSTQPVSKFSLTPGEVRDLVRNDALTFQAYREIKQAMFLAEPCADGDNERACISCLAEFAAVVMALHLKAERADAELAK